MEFRLVYTGKLKANGSPPHKWEIRRQLHPQIRKLWDHDPLAYDKQQLLADPPNPNRDSLIRAHISGWRFVPLVAQSLFLVAQLDILCLRPEPAGSIIQRGGDIDNRLKTLFDALRMPRHANEIPASEIPSPDETPFFCLLEDDALITKMSVTTDHLLAPVAPDFVQLVIHVSIKATRVRSSNIRIASI